MTSNESSSALRRRSLIAAGAWATPAIVAASASPAMAASGSTAPCINSPYTLDWANDGTWTDNGNNTGTYVSTLYPGLWVTISTAYFGNNAGSAATNMNLESPVGGTGLSGIRLQHEGGVTYANRVEWTVTFSIPVTDLKFAVTDVDDAARELMILTPAPATYSYNTNKMTGSGTQADPWRSRAGQIDFDNANSSNGNVDVTYSGQMSSFTVSLWEDAGQAKNHASLYLSALNFSAPCP